MVHGLSQLEWIKGILKDLKIENEEPSTLFYDNKSAISISWDPLQHDHMKHVDKDRHFVMEKLEINKVGNPFIESS